MKNKICFVYLAAVPYIILTLVTVHWYEYYRPSATTLAYGNFLFIFTLLLYPVIGILLAGLHTIPRDIYGTKWAKGILAVNFVVPIVFWTVYYTGLGGLGVKLLFFVRVPSFTIISLLVMGYYLFFLAERCRKKAKALERLKR